MLGAREQPRGLQGLGGLGPRPHRHLPGRPRPGQPPQVSAATRRGVTQRAPHDPVPRLQCADDAVWNQTVAAVEHEQAAAMARHCRQEICRGNLACAATCLEHVMQVARAEAALDTWLACSTSPACSPSCRYLDICTIYTIYWVSTLSICCSTASTCSVERLACSDQCLQRRRDEEAAAEAARRLGGTEQLAILASSAQLPGLAWPLLVLCSTLVW